MKQFIESLKTSYGRAHLDTPLERMVGVHECLKAFPKMVQVLERVSNSKEVPEQLKDRLSQILANGDKDTGADHVVVVKAKGMNATQRAAMNEARAHSRSAM